MFPLLMSLVVFTVILRLYHKNGYNAKDRTDVFDYQFDQKSGFLNLKEDSACHDFEKENECLKHSERNLPCYWCRSAAVASACYNETQANLLPSAVFQCEHKNVRSVFKPTDLEQSTNLSVQRCEDMVSLEDCEENHHYDGPCHWGRELRTCTAIKFNENRPIHVRASILDELDALSYVSIKKLFADWRKVYRKKYTDATDVLHHFHTFKDSVHVVEQHNKKNSQQYSLTLTYFADIEWSVFQQQYLGLAPQNCSATHSAPNIIQSSMDVPLSRDWRDEGVVSMVKNQEKCGSCWTFSTTGCLESHLAIKTGNMTLLSEQNLIDCASKFDNHGCNGGLPSHAFEYVQYNDGIDTEESYPYTAKTGDCVFNVSNVGAKVQNVVNITYQDEEQLRQAVGTVGPVSVAFQVASDFRFYRAGVYDSKNCKNGIHDVNHAVLAIGYDSTSDNTPYWIIKNSWGPTWGLQGYFYIRRGKNMCGIADCAAYPIV